MVTRILSAIVLTIAWAGMMPTSASSRALGQEAALPSLEELIAGTSAAIPLLENIMVYGELSEEIQCPDTHEWHEGNLYSRQRAWLMGAGDDRARIDVERRVSRWIGGPAPFAESARDVGYDGQTSRWVEHRAGPREESFAASRARITEGRHLSLRPNHLPDASGRSLSMHYWALGLAEGPRSLLEELETEIYPVFQSGEIDHTAITHDTINEIPCVRIEAVRPGIVEKRYWIAPERGHALVGFELINFRDGEPFVVRSARVTRLEEVAPGVWYPTEGTYKQTRHEDGVLTRRTYRAEEVVANDPEFDESIFTVPIPPGYTVVDELADGAIYIEGDSPDDAQEAALPSPEELIAGTAAAISLLENIMVYGELSEEIQCPDTHEWHEGNLYSRQRAWLMGAGDDRARIDVERRVSRWVDGAAPFSENAYDVGYDGQTSRRVEHRTGPLGESFGAGRARITEGRHLSLRPNHLPDASGRSMSVHYWALGLCGGPRSLLEHFETEFFADAAFQSEEIPFPVIEHDTINGIPCVKLEIVRPGLVEERYWIAPERGHALVGYELINFRDGEPIVLDFSRVTRLEEVAPGVWYPTEGTYKQTRHEDGVLTRRTYRAEEVVANDPEFDESIFTVPIPPGYTVVDELAGGAIYQVGLPADQLEPELDAMVLKARQFLDDQTGVTSAEADQVADDDTIVARDTAGDPRDDAQERYAAATAETAGARWAAYGLVGLAVSGVIVLAITFGGRGCART